MQQSYGFPQMVANYWKQDVDFYVLSNEDLGFNANLVTGTNDVESFALPYPATCDLSEETIVVYALEFLFQAEHAPTASLTFSGLIAFLSFLDKPFSATFRGVAQDAEDEALKSKFARNIFFGRQYQNLVATASVEGSQRNADSITDAIYFPPTPLDCATPLFIDLVNQNVTAILATNVVAAADFASFEQVSIVVWFKKRKLTRDELMIRNSGMRFMRLDA